MPRQGKPSFPVDPQLDVNGLILLLAGVPEWVTYVQANQTSGLSYNLATQAEFLAQGKGGQAQLAALENQYGIRLIQDISRTEIDAAVGRLQGAFSGDPLRRVLREADARVAASAFLKNEDLATSDLQFFKRAKDLGLKVEFVGSGRAAALAAAYQPRPVMIPGP